MNYNNKNSANSLYKQTFSLYDVILKTVTAFSAFIVIGVFLCIIIYILVNGAPRLSLNLIFNNNKHNALLPVILNTIYVQLLTLLIAAPIGIATAIYITQYKKRGKIIEFINLITNILASIPSILFGMFGYNILCILLGIPPSILVGCLTLACAILPNIIATTKEALILVPTSYKQGALALGASKFKAIVGLVIPCAMPGILTAIILSAGRIIGESAALLLTVGTSAKMPKGLFKHIFSSGRTLTLHLYFTAGNATSADSVEICFAIATILLILTFILNCLTKLIAKKFKR